MVEISEENAFFIDFNFQQVASAMGIDVSPEAAARLVLMTPTPVIEQIVNALPEIQAMQLTWDNADIQARVEALKGIASKQGVSLIDLVALFGTKPDPTLYCPDGLHPGPAGHHLIIEQVLKVINNYA